MAVKSNTSSARRLPLQSAAASAMPGAPDPIAQFKTRGFVLSEEADMILRDLFAAMDATAFAYDMDQGGIANFELTGDQVAAVLRSFSRLGKQVINGAPFTNEAMARNRDDL